MEVLGKGFEQILGKIPHSKEHKLFGIFLNRQNKAETLENNPKRNLFVERLLS